MTPADVRRCRNVESVHRAGPRALLELLKALGAMHGIQASIDDMLEEYAGLDPFVLEVLGGMEMPRPPLLAVP